MSSAYDIMYAAWAKDSEGLKAAVDQAMSSRVADAIDQMTADVTASMFGNQPSYEQEVETETSEELDSNEGITTDEDVQDSDQ